MRKGIKKYLVELKKKANLLNDDTGGENTIAFKWDKARKNKWLKSKARKKERKKKPDKHFKNKFPIEAELIFVSYYLKVVL